MEQDEQAVGEAMLLRGHHLLCILGFRGYGYSEEFVAGMWGVVNGLKENPEMMVEITVGQDLICSACPHRVGDTCPETKNAPGEQTGEHDRRVLTRLCFVPGEIIPWSTVLEKIKSSVGPDDLPELCRDCEWMPAGYCSEGLRNIKVEAS